MSWWRRAKREEPKTYYRIKFSPGANEEGHWVISRLVDVWMERPWFNTETSRSSYESCLTWVAARGGAIYQE